MRSFYPMSRGDLLTLALILGVALLAFLPWSKEEGWLGLDWLAWSMAALMVLSPAVALLRWRKQGEAA